MAESDIQDSVVKGADGSVRRSTEVYSFNFESTVATNGQGQTE